MELEAQKAALVKDRMGHAKKTGEAQCLRAGHHPMLLLMIPACLPA